MFNKAPTHTREGRLTEIMAREEILEMVEVSVSHVTSEMVGDCRIQGELEEIGI